jgi:hypothetical protein
MMSLSFESTLENWIPATAEIIRTEMKATAKRFFLLIAITNIQLLLA